MKRVATSIAAFVFAVYLGYLFLGNRAAHQGIGVYSGFLDEAALSLEATKFGWTFVAFEANVLKVKTNKEVGSDAIDAKLACTQPAVTQAKVSKIEISQATTGALRSAFGCAQPAV